MAGNRALASNTIVGIIGGMGPEATVDFMRRVVEATPARDDADHIHMIVDNNPKVPSRMKALIDGDGENPGPVIADMAKRLEGAGATFLVMPCHTAHHYYRYAAEAVGIPVWHLIEKTAAHVKALPGQPTRIGLLASTAVQTISLFEPFFTDAGLSVVYPADEDQAQVMSTIKAVKASDVTPDHIRACNRAAENLAHAGVEVLVLGCTELSVIAGDLHGTVPIIDPLHILAEEVVAACDA